MALIKCKECGHEVSDKATKCPKCGCPTTKEEEKPVHIEEAQPLYDEEDNGGRSHKWLYVIIALLLVILAGGSYYYFCYNHQKQEAEDREKFVKDSINQTRQDSINQARQDSINQVKQDSIKRAKLAEDYKVIKVDEDVCDMRLAVMSNGKLITTKIGEYMGVLEILDKHDYDGNGITDCLIMTGPGGANPCAYSIVYYDEDNNKIKTAWIDIIDIYDEGNYYEVNKVTLPQGKQIWQIIFKAGLEKRIFRFDGEKTTLYKIEKKKLAKTIKTFTHLSVFGTEETSDEETRRLEYDIDGDGVTETFTFYSNQSHAFDWGRSMSFDITWDNGKKSEGVYCAEKFEILSSKTKGLYDILADDLFLLKWDGKTYKKR